MAFDFISGTISVVSLIIIIIVSIVLYVNMQNNKKLFNAQIEDLIKQFNSGQTHIYNLTKKQGELQAQLEKKVKCVRCPGSK